MVIQSFLLIDGAPPALQALGWTMFLVVPVIVGSLNWVLVDLARIHPMVATLVTFTGIQAISLLMRPSPGGVISREISQTVTFKIGPVPVFFLLTLIVGLTLSWALL
ncbi:MAG: ABC transporter, partial [Aquiluna sp.]